MKTKQPKVDRTTDNLQGKRQRYVCGVPGCGFKVWAKHGASVLCGHHGKTGKPMT